MAQAIRDFLADGERAPAVLINAAVAVMVLGLAIAVGAMHWLK